MSSNTQLEYKSVISYCRDLFLKKNKDYGTAWRILRLPSITDQIYIKAQRIRSIQEKGKQMVNEEIDLEFVAMINYAIMALIQLQLKDSTLMEIPVDQLTILYDNEVERTYELLMAKNHDYGEAWREMRVSSITDIILMKIFRTKQIEDNQGLTIVSEGVDANYRDMLNYAVFALIRSGFLNKIA
ncbi:MAG TPA: DUF1599 domain-containing protein [Cytophagales bacterium]|nr:DUF1599 domain-containing protein [Cytophagales bacterium]